MARQMKDSGIEWIGEIPETWEAIKAKYLAHINHGTDPTTEGDIPVYGSGAESFKTCGEYKEGPTVLIGRKGATLHIPHYVEGRYWNVDTAFDVKVNNKYVLRMYYYAATCFDYKYYMSQTTLPGMTQTNYNNMSLPCPPLAEQQRIAAFLDRKCAEIDAVIEHTKATIEEYKKLKQAVITEAVTKGVRGPRPMKDSGIEWIGEIPEEWAVRKLGRFISIRSGITLGKTYPRDAELVELPYLRVANVKADGFALDDVATIEVTPDEAEKYALKTGELLMTEGGDRDKLGRGTIWHGEISPCLHQNHVFAATCDETWLLTQYLAYLTASNVGRQYFDITAKKTTNLACTNSNTILQFKIPLPSTEEQQEIIEWLPIRCAALDTLIAKKTALLTELETYKKSLIYEYVTGKKEVL